MNTKQFVSMIVQWTIITSIAIIFWTIIAMALVAIFRIATGCGG